MYQELTIVGNVGQDAEMRYLESGVPVTTFSVAINERYGDKETTTWFRVTCWRKLAEVCAQYVTKGKLVLVRGRVAGRAYTNRQGDAACSLDVTADVVKFLSSAEPHPDDDGVPASFTKPQHNDSVTEDIPF